MATLRPSPSPPGRGRRAVRSLAATVVVTIAAVSTAGCAGAPPEVTTDDPELITGRAIYASSCASCHGADGGGGVGTRLNDGSMVAAYPDIQDQIDLVANGEDRMPAFVGRLDDEQLRAVVRYTREVL